MRWLVLLAILLLPFAARADGRFLAMTDIHFDPLKDPSQADALAKAPATEWADLLVGGAPSGFGKDTDWTLLTATLDAMRQAEPKPDFILMPGDFLAHRLDTRFRQNGSRSDSAYLDFAAKTLQVIVQQTQQRFPGVPILPVLGNNDDACGDYRATDDDATMSSTLPILRAMLGGDPGRDLPADWTRLGSYDLPLAGVPHLRLIGLDDVFFSTHYKPCDGAADPVPDATLLGWLHDRLAAARQAGDHVWVMMHIPPGADVFATVTGTACPAAPAMMWQAGDLTAYTALVDEFADVVAAQFAGHTHMDEFRLVGSNGFLLGVPAVSPIYLQYPAFERYTYRPDGTLSGRVTLAYANFGDSTPPRWVAQDFGKAWSIPGGIDAGTLRDVARRLTDRPAPANPDLARYMLSYSTGHAGVWAAQHIDPIRAARVMACSAANTALAGLGACVCPP